MHNEILYILLPDFASHEMVYLMETISSDESQLKPNPKYVNKIVAPTMEPISAIGGFRVLPDCSFETVYFKTAVFPRFIDRKKTALL